MKYMKTYESFEHDDQLGFEVDYEDLVSEIQRHPNFGKAFRSLEKYYGNLTAYEEYKNRFCYLSDDRNRFVWGSNLVFLYDNGNVKLRDFEFSKITELLSDYYTHTDSFKKEDERNFKPTMFVIQWYLETTYGLDIKTMDIFDYYELELADDALKDMKDFDAIDLYESSDLGFEIEKDHPFFDIEITENETDEFKTLFFNFDVFKSFLGKLGIQVDSPVLYPIRYDFNSPATEFEITMDISSLSLNGEISATQLVRLEELLKEIPYTSDAWVIQTYNITLQFETGNDFDEVDID